MATVLPASEVKSYSASEITERLEAHGITRATFARMCGVSSVAIYNVLGGKRHPSRLLVIRMAEILDAIGEEHAPAQPADVEPRLRRL